MTHSVKAILISSALCSLGMIGCSTTSTGGKSPNTVGGYWGGPSGERTAPAPAPAPAKTEAAKPAPAPAPVASGACGPGMSQTSLALPTGSKSTSVLNIDRCMPVEVIAGQNFTYTYKVCNLTSTEVSNVILKDMCAPSMQIVGSEPAASGTAPNLWWNLGTLAPGQCKTVTVTAKSAASGQVGSCATAEWAQSFCQEVAVVQPALKVDLAMQPNALKCDTICGKVTVTNTGTGIARDAKATVTLPAGFTTTDGKTGSAVFSAGDLAPKQSKSFDICGTVKATGSFCSTAAATANPGLTASAAQACTTVTAPALKITAECPTGGIVGRGGRNLTFKFTVTNTGNAACDTTVTSPVPAGTTFVSADNAGAGGASVSWKLGSLAPNASKTVSMVVNAKAAGSFNASATATCACADPVSANCSTSTTGVPDIGTLVTDADGVVGVGSPHVYTCEVMNQGMVNLTNVKMVVTIPADLTFISSDANPKVGGGKLEFAIGTLAPGATRRFTFTAKASKAGEILVVGETTCSELKTPVRDDELTNYVAE